jgi:hypothetical protein
MKHILLIVSMLLMSFVFLIPICVLISVEQPLTGAQIGLIGCLMTAAGIGSYLYYVLYKEHKNGPQTF